MSAAMSMRSSPSFATAANVQRAGASELADGLRRRARWLALLAATLAPACGRTDEAGPAGDGGAAFDRGGAAGREGAPAGGARTSAGNAGDDGASGGVTGALAEPASCDDLRDHPPGEPLTIVVRNERSEPIYLALYSASFLGCEEQPLARVQRAGADLAVTVPDCALVGCNTALGNPSAPLDLPCNAVGCLPRGEVLAPGAELAKAYAGEWIRQRLRAECYSEPPVSVLSAEGAYCSSHQPLADGDYTVTARAFSEVGPATTVETFFQLPDSTRVGGVPETELIAQVTLTSPHGVAELVFRDSADAGAAGLDAAAGSDASFDR
jgi:hypothetical protein